MKGPVHITTKQFGLLMLLLVAAGGFGMGCATTDRDYDSDLPWNTPQTWEGSPSMPGLEER